MTANDWPALTQHLGGELRHLRVGPCDVMKGVVQDRWQSHRLRGPANSVTREAAQKTQSARITQMSHECPWPGRFFD
jgi:hypothetical protein